MWDHTRQWSHWPSTSNIHSDQTQPKGCGGTPCSFQITSNIFLLQAANLYTVQVTHANLHAQSHTASGDHTCTRTHLYITCIPSQLLSFNETHSSRLWCRRATFLYYCWSPSRDTSVTSFLPLRLECLLRANKAVSKGFCYSPHKLLKGNEQLPQYITGCQLWPHT